MRPVAPWSACVTTKIDLLGLYDAHRSVGEDLSTAGKTVNFHKLREILCRAVEPLKQVWVRWALTPVPELDL